MKLEVVYYSTLLPSSVTVIMMYVNVYVIKASRTIAVNNSSQNNERFALMELVVHGIIRCRPLATSYETKM
jgi:hypothetical protein